MISAIKRFAARADGSAGTELALGPAMVVAETATAFDLYTRINAHGMVGRAAVALVEYAALDPAPEIADMQALTELVHS